MYNFSNGQVRNLRHFFETNADDIAYLFYDGEVQGAAWVQTLISRQAGINAINTDGIPMMVGRKGFNLHHPSRPSTWVEDGTTIVLVNHHYGPVAEIRGGSDGFTVMAKHPLFGPQRQSFQDYAEARVWAMHVVLGYVRSKVQASASSISSEQRYSGESNVTGTLTPDRS